MNYYNEFDPTAAAWLRELIKQNQIAPGEVDERSIEDVVPSDLRGFKQCHFFAGIGVWSYALRRAGWPDDRPVWTGSCPCQPFSAAGKGKGTADERHLWPAFFHLIRQCRPDCLFGEQVEAAIRHGWLDLVQADLERSGYACGAVCAPAAGFGAPHIRPRIFFVADAEHDGRGGPAGRFATITDCDESHERIPNGNRAACGMADTSSLGCQRRRSGEACLREDTSERRVSIVEPERHGDACRMGKPIRTRLEGHAGNGDDGNQSRRLRAEQIGSTAATGCTHELGDAERRGCGMCGSASGCCGRASQSGEALRPSPTNGFWGAADWLHCTDGKWRPVEPSTFPLAHGAPARVGRLRGYGNAIVAPQAQAFIEAYLAVTEPRHKTTTE